MENAQVGISFNELIIISGQRLQIYSTVVQNYVLNGFLISYLSYFAIHCWPEMSDYIITDSSSHE